MKYSLVSVKSNSSRIKDLFQVVAEEDFVTINGEEVHKGDKGGYVKNEKNLSQEGKCWLDSKSVVKGDNVRIKDDAYVIWSTLSGNAVVCGQATTYRSDIGDNAVLKDNARTDFLDGYGGAELRDNAVVGGYATVNGVVHGNCVVDGNAELDFGCTLKGNIRLTGDAIIRNADCLNTSVKLNNESGNLVIESYSNEVFRSKQLLKNKLFVINEGKFRESNMKDIGDLWNQAVEKERDVIEKRTMKPKTKRKKKALQQDNGREER